MTLNDTVVGCLQREPGRWFTTGEIARLVIESDPEKAAAKRARSPRLVSDDLLVAQLRAEIAAAHPYLLRRYPALEVDLRTPRRYRWPGPHRLTRVRTHKQDSLV